MGVNPNPCPSTQTFATETEYKGQPDSTLIVPLCLLQHTLSLLQERLASFHHANILHRCESHISGAVRALLMPMTDSQEREQASA